MDLNGFDGLMQSVCMKLPRLPVDYDDGGVVLAMV